MGRPRAIYPIGTQYHVSTLLEVYEYPDNKPTKGRFRCDCGKEFIARISSVVSGNTLGCGCRTDHAATHRLSRHELYDTYTLIKTRCYCTTNVKYKWYGARGITMADEFLHDAKAFIDYVTSLPRYNERKQLRLTLDRIDNNKGYERGNLRWATQTEQIHNRRDRVHNVR